jgi:hypothetical protein
MVQRYDFISVPPNFLMKSFVVSELLLTFAFEHRHDVRVRTAVGHSGKKQSIRYYFAFSQKRRKLIGNKKRNEIIRDEMVVMGILCSLTNTNALTLWCGAYL